jgi:hypothetical protein
MRLASRPIVSCLAVVLVGSVSLLANHKGPPAEVTGGFREDTCNSCHDTYALNEGRRQSLGDVVITGFPASYQPGESYPIKLEVTHVKDRDLWGFELATRFKDGSQAGHLKSVDGNSQILSEKGIEYIQHTADGTFSNVFTFTWTAPDAAMGEVSVHAAANAANADADTTGDYIYSTALTVPGK